MDNVTGSFQYIDTREAMDIPYQYGAFDFTSFSADTHSCYQNSDTFHQTYGEQFIKMNSCGGPAPPSSSKISLEPYQDFESTKRSTYPYLTDSSITSCSTGDSRDFDNSFQTAYFTNRNSSFYFVETCAQGPVQVSPYGKLLSSSKCPKNLGTTYLKMSNCSKSSPTMDLGFSSASSSSCKLGDSMPKETSSGAVKTCINDVDKTDLPLGDPPCGKQSGLLRSFASELLNDIVTNASDLTPESSVAMQPKDTQVSHLCDEQTKHVAEDAYVQINASVRSGGVGDKNSCHMITKSSATQVEYSISAAVNSLMLESEINENSSLSPTQLLSDNDLFHAVGLDMRVNSFLHELWDDISIPGGEFGCSNLNADVSYCISAMETGSIHGTVKSLFSESGLQHLLDAVVVDHVNKSSTHGSGAKYLHPISGHNLEHQFSPSVGSASMYRNQATPVGLSSLTATANLLLPNLDNFHGSKQVLPNSNICSWIDDTCSRNTENSTMNQSRKPEEAAKIKKRARPGESTRPRPKDRQQIQDRLKELREIVPNGAKCSIDALLDKTIKHLLFLQSVTKYADKLKQADEPKIIREESGVVLKDNPGSAIGGATWAYEVAGQTMVCPIIVEDLTPPGQMLVEMLCEERGLFLELADIIRGFGLIILKGVMEIRECKIWARFLVEANKEVTRMDIFFSLIHLLQQNSCLRSGDMTNKVVDKDAPIFPSRLHCPVSTPVSLSNRLQ